MTDESTMRDHIEDLQGEVQNLRRLLETMEGEAEQWWLLAAQYRNNGDHAGRCLGDLRCRLCALFHRNEERYGKHHGAGFGPL